jgi:hypothetical protein
MLLIILANDFHCLPYYLENILINKNRNQSHLSFFKCEITLKKKKTSFPLTLEADLNLEGYNKKRSHTGSWSF